MRTRVLGEYLPWMNNIKRLLVIDKDIILYSLLGIYPKKLEATVIDGTIESHMERRKEEICDLCRYA